MDNECLKNYEIKGPDYDYLERESYLKAQNILYEPDRYKKSENVWVNKENDIKKDHVKIMVAGDITCFQNQFDEACQDGEYDFKYEFEVIKNIFAQSDLAIGNLETMIDTHAPYRIEKFVSEQNYHCNAPVEFLEAVKTAGFDVLTNANNHDMDTGASGIGETIDNIERLGFIQTGTFKADKKHYEVIDVFGFRIAVIAFATEHNNKGHNFSAEGREFLLNDYSEEKAVELIEAARRDGAEVILTCIHWGRENVVKNNKAQVKIAKELAKAGADCIIGSHPHVLQPFSFVKVEGKKIPVFYSMGNFISHNVDGTKGRSIIACIDLKRDKEIKLECKYIPIYTSGNYNKRKFVVLPLDQNSRNKKNLSRFHKIQSIIGEKIVVDTDISFDEYVEKKEFKGINLKNIKLKKSEPDLSKIKKWPYIYEDDTFCYEIHKDHVCLAGKSREFDMSSCNVPKDILGIPVLSIKESAFEKECMIRKISFSKDITTITKAMFKNSESIEGFRIGLNTKKIEEEAFYGCKNLSAVVMRNSIKIIESKAFADCPSLRCAKINSEIEEIAPDAFAGSPKLVIYCEENTYAEDYAKKHNIRYINMKLS